MRVLGLDTAFASLGVALWEGEPGAPGDVLAHENEAMGRGHAEALMPMVERVMARAGIGFDGLDRVAVTRGPGAFTGIRIGLAAARGLALAASVPCVGLTTIQAVAANVEDAERDGRALLVALDTKRGDFYAHLFSGAVEAATGQVVAGDDLAALVGDGAPVLVTGDGAAAAVAILSEAGLDAMPSTAGPFPDARRVAALGAPSDDTGFPAPLYLRPPAVTVPGQGRTG